MSKIMHAALAATLLTTALTGCGHTQTFPLASAPSLAALEQQLQLTVHGASDTVSAVSVVKRDFTAGADDTRPAAQFVAQYAPDVDAAVAAAGQTQAASQNLAHAAVVFSRQQRVFAASAQRVYQGEISNARQVQTISHSASYRLGHFLLTLFWLAVILGSVVGVSRLVLLFSPQASFLNFLLTPAHWVADGIAVAWNVLETVWMFLLGIAGQLIRKIFGKTATATAS